MSQIAFAESSPMSHMPKPPSSPTLMPFTPAWVDEEAEPLVPGNDQGSPDKFVADTPGPSALHAQASSFADAMAKPPPPPRDVTAPLPPTLSPVPKPDDAPPTPKTPVGTTRSMARTTTSLRRSSKTARRPSQTSRAATTSVPSRRSKRRSWSPGSARRRHRRR